jgi:hypothetical protein
MIQRIGAYLYRFLAPVRTAHNAIGVIKSAASVLTIRATGTTAGSRRVLNEKLPDAQAAKSSPNVTEKIQLITAANNILFSTTLIFMVFPSRAPCCYLDMTSFAMVASCMFEVPS